MLGCGTMAREERFQSMLRRKTGADKICELGGRMMARNGHPTEHFVRDSGEQSA